MCVTVRVTCVCVCDSTCVCVSVCVCVCVCSHSLDLSSVNKTVGQTLIRYSVQMGYITIPKTEKSARITENAEVFDWAIPDEEMARLVMQHSVSRVCRHLQLSDEEMVRLVID